MIGKIRLAAIFVAGAVSLVICSGAAVAQNTQASLTQQLAAYYKVTKMGSDSGGWAVTDPGTVLMIQKGGILGVPPTNMVIGVSSYKDGILKGPGFKEKLLLGPATRLLTIGEKVYVLKIEVNVKNERVGLMLMECDTCNGTQQRSSYKAGIQFQFPKDYLESADVTQVEDLISQVLTVDQGDAGQQAAPDNNAGPLTAPPGNQPPANPAPPPPAVKLGMSFDEVKAIKGQPDSTAEVGPKTIYVYKDMKIIFMNGKVSDVQ